MRSAARSPATWRACSAKSKRGSRSAAWRSEIHGYAAFAERPRSMLSSTASSPFHPPNLI